MSTNISFGYCCGGNSRGICAIVFRNGYFNFLYPAGEFEKAYNSTHHFKFITCLSYERVRSNNFGSTPDLTNGTGTWNASKDRYSNVETGTIPGDLDGTTDPTWGYIWVLNSTTITPDGLERTRVYDGYISGTPSGIQITEVDTISDPYTDSDVYDDLSDLYDSVSWGSVADNHVIRVNYELGTGDIVTDDEFVGIAWPIDLAQNRSFLDLGQQPHLFAGRCDVANMYSIRENVFYDVGFTTPPLYGSEISSGWEDDGSSEGCTSFTNEDCELHEVSIDVPTDSDLGSGYIFKRILQKNMVCL